MDARLVFSTVIVLLLVALAGCLGTEEGGRESRSNAAVGDPDEALNGSTQVYRTVSGGGPRQVDPGEALGDLPPPVSLGRSVDAPLFEPTIGVTSEGTLLLSNADSDPIVGALAGDVPDGAEFSGVLRSTDEGQTWEDVTDNVGPASLPPTSNDPYVYVDRDTDRVYTLQMTGFNCNWLQFSDDEGETWTNNPLGCGQPPVLDHPTIFAGEPTTLETTAYENIVYLCVNRFGGSACATSLDGGLTWTPFRTVYSGVDPDGNVCGGLHAHGTTGPDGTAYLPKGHCRTPTVAISEDDGLTWEQVVISEEVRTTEDQLPNGHEVAFAVDDQGNAFAFWIGEDLKPYLAVSTDGGHEWREPVDVSPPDVATTSHPTIAAGENGSIAMAYVGTRTPASDDYPEMPDEATWNGYISTVVDATVDNVTVTTVTANDPDHPIGRGTCGGDRCRAPDFGGGLGDFIDVTIDDDGRPWAAFVDVCHEECEQPGGPSQNQDAQGLLGTFREGPALVGDPADLPPLDTDVDAD